MKIPFTCFYALVQAAGIKTVRIKAGRLRAPATDCFLEVREFAVWKRTSFWTLAQSRPLPGIRL